MKLLNISVLYLSFILITGNIFAQDDFKDYKPPNLMKGFNLILHTSPGFNSSLENETRRSLYHADLNTDIDYWRFTDNFLFAINNSAHADAYKSYSGISNLSNDDVSNPDVYTSFNFTITGGASYYIPSTNFYANLYLRGTSHFQNHRYPDFSSQCYPGIGFGRLYNASRVSQMQNFEKALMNEKIIKTPLKNNVRKKLIELLDKRYDRDFISMFRDDNEIEFFSRVEDLLRNEGVILANLDSRSILRMYQSLNNSSYVYFPVFKGFQVQAESKLYTVFNDYLPSPYIKSERHYSFLLFNELMLSAIFGLPVSNKLSFVGTVYSLFPLAGKYLDEKVYYEFHSPATLIEPNDGSNLPFSHNAGSSSLTKVDFGLSIQGFYSFNSFCGLSAGASSDLKLNDFGSSDFIGKLNTSFNFNILNHLNMRMYFYIYTFPDVKYDYTFGTNVAYYVF